MLSSSIIALDVGVACHETKHQFRCCSSYLHVVVVDLQVLGPLRLVLNAPRSCLPVIFFLEEGANLTEHEVSVSFQLQLRKVALPHLVEVVTLADMSGHADWVFGEESALNFEVLVVELLHHSFGENAHFWCVHTFDT